MATGKRPPAGTEKGGVITATAVALSAVAGFPTSAPSRSATRPPLSLASRVIVTCTAGSGNCPAGAGSVTALGASIEGDDAARFQYPVVTVPLESWLPSEAFSLTAAAAEAAAAEQLGPLVAVDRAEPPPKAAASAAFCNSPWTLMTRGRSTAKAPNISRNVSVKRNH